MPFSFFILLLLSLPSQNVAQNNKYLNADWTIRYYAFQPEIHRHRINTRESVTAINFRYHSETVIEKERSITSISRTVYNPNFEKEEYLFAVPIPQNATITQVFLGEEVRPIGGNPTSLEYDGKDQWEMSANNTLDLELGESEHCFTRYSETEFRMVVILEGKTEYNLSITYMETQFQKNELNTLRVWMSPGEIVQYVTATISTEDGDVRIKNVTSPFISKLPNIIKKTENGTKQSFALRMDNGEQASFGFKGFNGYVDIEYEIKNQSTVEVISDDKHFLGAFSVLSNATSTFPMNITFIPPEGDITGFMLAQIIMGFSLGLIDQVDKVDNFTTTTTTRNRTEFFTELISNKRSDHVNIGLNGFINFSGKEHRLTFNVEVFQEEGRNIVISKYIDDLHGVRAREFAKLVLDTINPNVAFKNLTLEVISGADKNSVTKNQFPTVYKGDILTFSGDLDPEDYKIFPRMVDVRIIGIGSLGPIDKIYKVQVQETENPEVVDTVNSLLKTRQSLVNQSEATPAKTQELQMMNLRHGFLTPYTALKSLDTFPIQYDLVVQDC